MDFLKTPEMRLHDDLKIEAVLQEIDSGIRDNVAWVKALKKAEGNESYALALYIDERIRRLQDAWNVEQRSLMSDPEFKLAQKLASLEKKHDEAKVKSRSFNVTAISLLVISMALSVSMFWAGENDIGLFLAIFSVAIFCFSIVWGSRLEAKKDSIRREITRSSANKDKTSHLTTIFLIIAIGATAWYFYS